MDAADREHGGLDRWRITRDQRLQGNHQLSAGQHRIGRLVRHGGVATRTRESDDKGVGRGIDRARAHVDLPDLELVPQVQPEARVGPGVQGTVLEHALRSADALFGRLKDEQYRARQIGLARRQQLGDRQQDGGVAIMATGVVRALLNRAVGLAAIGLGERQSVDVRAQHHRAAGAGALQHADDARLTYGCTHAMEPKLAQTVGDDSSRAVLLVRELWVAVKIAPQLDQSLALLSGQHPRVASEL